MAGQDEKEQPLTLVLTFDRATHGVGIGGTVPDFATAVAMLRQALDYYETQRIKAEVTQAVVQGLQQIADQRRVSAIVSGVRQ